MRSEAIEDGAVGRRATYDVLPLQPDLTSPNGALWKATLASEEKGRRAWEEIVASNIAAVRRELTVAETW